jgi:hypothetical protein
MLLWRVAIRHHFLQPRPILRRDMDLHTSPHRTQLAHFAASGNPTSRPEH